jgi:hypothetical protein
MVQSRDAPKQRQVEALDGGWEHSSQRPARGRRGGK